MSESTRPSNARYTRLPPWVFALVLIVFLALAVIASNLIYAALSRQDAILVGSPGDLLYVAAFSGFDDEWDLYDGQQSAQIVDEQLELTVTTPRTATWSTARHRFRDFDYSVTATAGQGPIDNALGVVFRARDQEDGACDLPAIILCGIDQLLPLAGAAIRQALAVTQSHDYFTFLISSDGYYSLWKSETGRTKLLSAWIASPHINQGLDAANAVRVVARAASYRFFVNGAQVSVCIPDDPAATSTFVGGECIDGSMTDIFHDDSFATGKLGVIAQSTATGGGGLVLRFDNVLVFSPADPTDEDAKA